MLNGDTFWKKAIDIIKKVIEFLLTKVFFCAFIVFVIFCIYDTFFADPDFNFIEYLRKMNATWQAGAFMIGMAIFAFIISNLRRWLLKDNIAVTVGRVYAVEGDSNSDGNWTYYPFIEFYVNGIQYTFEGEGLGERISVNEQIRVMYNKNDPNQAWIYSSGRDRLGLLIVVSVIGLCWIIIDLFFLK